MNQESTPWGSNGCHIRIRMSSHDAHYAGELVDGARILSLFGDVATELLLRHDGDEGLFRAYESIEFLAPVFAGDYIEAYGEIVRVGRTSRTLRFEARKVAGNLRRVGAPASQGAAIEPSVLVARAIGTCVVPIELQRVQTQSVGSVALPDLILTAAIVGAEVTRKQNPHVPYTAEEIADEAARCREAGASVIHLHVRDEAGNPTQDHERFAKAIEAIQRKTDVIVQVSTGGAVGMSIEERCGPLRVRPAPEMATLNCGTINFGNDVFVNTRSEIRDIAKRIQEAGSMPECEIYELGHLDEALVLAHEQRLKTPLHVQFVLGVPGACAARESALRFFVSELMASQVEHTWGVAAVGRHQQPMTELAIRLGGHARVGLEDNLYLEKGILAQGSAPLVLRAAQYAEKIGRKIAPPTRARELLGLSSKL